MNIFGIAGASAENLLNNLGGFKRLASADKFSDDLKVILSAGTRNKIVQYFVKTLNGTGKVIATDMSNLAPAIYEADKYYIVPKMTAPEYLDVVLDICKKEEVTGVLGVKAVDSENEVPN